MSTQNKALAARTIEEVWNRGNFELVEEFVSRDFVVHGSYATGDVYGIEGVRNFFGALRNAFPDLYFTIEDQIAEGDRVVTRWAAEGTHTGEFQGIPPTGKRCAINGIDVDRFASGKVVECWSNYDELGLMMQLGVVPEPEQTETAAN